MKRLHVHVAVNDIPQSIGFYSALFAAQPAVIKADYAKWMLDDPRVNFAISTRGREPGLDHLGIQVENADELQDVYARLRQARRRHHRARTDRLLLREVGKIVDRRSGGHRVGNLPHHRRKHRLRRWQRRARRASRMTKPAARRSRAPPKRFGLLLNGASHGRSSFNVLFLCTGNSARSIIAEAILNKLGAGKFRAYSAGSQPKGQVNPTHAFSSCKAWLRHVELSLEIMERVRQARRPKLDFVFTVCDNAAGESCPVWPGQPMTAHWGVPDPAEAKGTPAEIALAFKDAYRMLHQRIGVFTALPIREPGSAQPATTAQGHRPYG